MLSFTLFLSTLSLGSPQPNAAGVDLFEQRVRPLLETHCLRCHGPKGKPKGGLRLTSRDAVLKGGDLGPAVSLEQPKESLLLRAIGYRDEDLQMPPPGKLPQEAIDLLTKWVEAGVPWGRSGESVQSPESPQSDATPEAAADQHPQPAASGVELWSFRPVVHRPTPALRNGAWAQSPIDAFIFHPLEANDFAPAPPAPREALFRRLTYGVTGLPPVPEDLERFLADDSPLAHERLVGRLLASPRYGERWGRHWLDVVRYAETNSFERDSPKPHAWRFRDYVIDSLNRDKPYDLFVREQLAGDELDDASAESIIATGYYRLGPWDDEPTDPLQARYDELDDVVATTGQAFLGLTLNCARCHDHKLDPIPQVDYYRVLAFFHGVLPTTRGNDGTTSTRIHVPSEAEEQRRNQEAIATRKAAARAELAVIEEGMRTRLPQAGGAAPSGDELSQLLKSKARELLNDEDYRRYKRLHDELKELARAESSTASYALSVKEVGRAAPPTHVLVRGNAHSRGPVVESGFLSALGGATPLIPEPPEGAKSSGRRRVLAEWIADAENPLAARVISNRIWQHHFGRGIVASPNNFGKLGDPPTHPELLDWLAGELVRSGWRLKPLHRSILTSSAYRMSAYGGADATQKDPENRLFSRQNPRRLSAEELRDSLLALNGRLNLQMGGPSIYTEIPAEVLQGQSQPGSGWGKSSPDQESRRSVYIHVKRSLIPPLLAGFDFADTDSSCPVRFATTQPTQALTLLNSEALHREAAEYARRLRREAGEAPEAQVRLALELACCREPSQSEVREGERLIADLRQEGSSAEEALRLFALMVLNLNEFLFID